MPVYSVQAPDGRVYEIEGPEGATAEQLGAVISGRAAPAEPAAPAGPTLAQRANTASIPLIGPALAAAGVNVDPGKAAKGIASGFADLGDTLINRMTKAGADAMPNSPLIDPRLIRPPAGVTNLVSGQPPMSQAEKENAARSASLEAFNKDNASPEFGVGRVLGNIAATAPIGGAIAAPVRAAAPALGPLADAIASGGFRTGLAPTTLAGQVGNTALRGLGGAINGAASVGAVDPSAAGTGALIGAALPGGAAAINAGGRLIGRGLSGGATATPEVQKLAERAAELGIKIPADRLINSRPLNAVASSLNYLPLSGRAATEEAMQTGLNRALSRTFGQDSENVTMALRKAQGDLGGKFDQVLRSNSVNVDQQFFQDLADAANQAVKELPSDGAGVITRQVDEILAKAGEGTIDGQAAYNLKKGLDRIGQRNSPEAFYARDLKKALMAALNRSLTPEDAAAFALTRKQYSNMLTLENLAQNGIEGNVSIARLANMKGPKTADLQELADISAQFLKPREAQHGSAQRIVLGTLGAAGAAGGAPVLPMLGGIAAGRAANTLLNSPAARNVALGKGTGLLGASIPEAGLLYRGAPLLGINDR